jgi:Protein of unknown function (DUF3237)
MSILMKTCVALASTATLCLGQLDLWGNLYDYNDGKAVSGATIRLTNAAGVSSELSTDANGKFTFTAALALPAPDAATSPGILRNGQAFLFHHGTDGQVDVRIHSLTGRGSVPVFSGRLDAGHWRFDQPRLAAGLYLCRIRTPEGEFAAKFLAVAEAAGSGPGFPERTGSPSRATDEGPAIGAKAKRGSMGARTDSLFITKPGYHPRRISLDSLPRVGLMLHLTDTAIGKSVTIIPHSSWTCGLPSGIAAPARGTAVFTATLTLGAIHPVGITPYGFRRLLDVNGGTITGTRINGTVHKGGLDMDLALREGTVEIEQVLILRASDGANIYVRGMGVALPGDPTGRVVLDFEAPTSGSHAWLNTGTYVATRTVDAAAKTVKMEVFDVSNVAATNPPLRITDSPNSPQQSPDCLKLTGSRGAVVLTENVTLGSSFSIAGKRGNRNVIPITGGTTSGRVVGKILAGGADYQLNGLDARYTLAPNDGELILVRNCGAMNGLVPHFEARTAGPYHFLNANNFLSSEPGVGSGGVTITFYQRQ